MAETACRNERQRHNLPPVCRAKVSLPIGIARYLGVGLLFVVAFTGCRGLATRGPKATQAIAAREQGQLGLQFLQRGKLDEAEVRFAHAIENCPEDVRLRHDLAVVRREQGRMEEAIVEMQRAVGQSGGEPAWLAELATMQLSHGDLDGARQSADKAIERQPSLASAWQVRGDVFNKSGRHEDALRDYHRALSEGGDSPELLMQVADTYRMLGRPRRALSTLQRMASNFAPEDHPPQLPFARALAYQALDRHDEALPHFLIAQEQQGSQPLLLTQMAISQWQVGSRDAARASLTLASQIEPQNPRIIALLTEWQPTATARVAATE